MKNWVPIGSLFQSPEIPKSFGDNAQEEATFFFFLVERLHLFSLSLSICDFSFPSLDHIDGLIIDRGVRHCCQNWYFRRKNTSNNLVKKIIACPWAEGWRWLISSLVWSTIKEWKQRKLSNISFRTCCLTDIWFRAFSDTLPETIW